MQDKLMLFAVDTPASHSVCQGKGKQKMIRATSGRKCGASFEKYAPAGSLPRMLEGMLSLASTKLPHNWKMTASPSGRLLYQLEPSVPGIEGIGSGLLPTPAAKEPGWKNIEVVDKYGNPPLHWNQRFYDKNTGRLVQKGLTQVAQMWPDGPGCAPQKPTGQLNPAWVERLMGFTIGWAGCTRSGTPSFHKSRKSSVA